ncbi:hypothetical protein JXA85_00935 [Candidatus Woesearchaeota archaeon]|nr:hypothetical protein [Candidatus Woesearchaeota archaeon]
MEKKDKELDEQKTRISKLIRNIEATRKIKPTEPKEGIMVIEGKKNYLNLSVKLHEKAKREWRSIHTLPLYQPHLEAYKKMIKRGVKTRIIAPIEKKGSREHNIWKETGADIRFSSKIISGFTIIDDIDVVLRMKDLVIGRYTAVLIQSPALARTLINQFERLWNS